MYVDFVEMDFKPSDGFFDLCINVTSENIDCLDDILSRLYQSKSVPVKNYSIVILFRYFKLYLLSVGYRTVALNQTVHEDSFIGNSKKKKKKGEENKTISIWDVVPNPIDANKLNEKFKGTLCILNRITFVCSDPVRTHTLV